MNNQNREEIDLLTESLADREAMLSDANKIRCIELYESLRSKVLSIYNLHFDSNLLIKEAKRLEKTSERFWRFYILLTVILGLGYYLKQTDDAWKIAIVFAQIIITSFFLLQISEINNEKTFIFQNSQLKINEALRIEHNLRLFGESYEYSETLLRFIKMSKDGDSIPFHEIEHASDILQIKLSIAKTVSLSY